MGRTKSQQSTEAPSHIQLDLFGPGMTALHRAGLAGLWMTLDHFESEGVAVDGGSWEKDDNSVTLRWDDEPGPFFESLITKTFKLDENGLIWFAPLGEPMDHLQAAIMAHEAVLGTFLQHGKSKNALKDLETRVVEIDEQPWTFSYKFLKSYKHQEAAAHVVKKGRLTANQALAGWLFPGGGVRHKGFTNQSTLSETGDRLLLLLFSVIGGVYFRIRQRKEGARPLYALVLPEVSSLESFAFGRKLFIDAGIAELTCAGTAEAGWRFLSRVYAKRLLPQVSASRCRVISFGVVPWAQQQKTRIELLEVMPGREQDLSTFLLCEKALKPRIVKPDDGDAFLDVASSPELIARNLTEGRPWYVGFAGFLTDKKKRNHILRYERGGLHEMVKKAHFDDESCRRFVEVCHEAWRRRMGQLGERARRESVDFRSLTSKEYERQRVAFSRCKNGATLRQAVTDFWARTGPHKRLVGWQGLLPLLDEARWQEARDLALLALASYQPASNEEQKALDVADTQEGVEEGEEQ